MFSNGFQKSCYLWSNMEKHGRVGQTTDNSIIQHRHIGCWMNMATKTHSEYVTLPASPWQKQLHASASVSHYTNNAYPVPQYFQQTSGRYTCPCPWWSIIPYKDILGNRGTAARFLDFGTRLKQAVSFQYQPLYHQGNTEYEAGLGEKQYCSQDSFVMQLTAK